MGDVVYDLVQRVIDWQLRSRFISGVVVDGGAGDLEDKLVWALDNQERVLEREVWRLRWSGFSERDICRYLGVGRGYVRRVLCGYKGKGER